MSTIADIHRIVADWAVNPIVQNAKAGDLYAQSGMTALSQGKVLLAAQGWRQHNEIFIPAIGPPRAHRRTTFPAHRRKRQQVVVWSIQSFPAALWALHHKRADGR